jgi:hypothetical protein
MKFKPLLFIAALATLGGAQAQTQNPNPSQNPNPDRHRRAEVNQPVAQACKSEIQQMCQGQTGQQAEQCLRNNQQKLSPQCKGAVTKSPE